MIVIKFWISSPVFFQTKEEVRQVLTMEYTSSDESSYECDSDREEAELAVLRSVLKNNLNDSDDGCL